MGKIPEELKETIAHNIRALRMRKFPGRGGSKKCAEAFGVSPQQWSPWERGMRTPDETRMKQLAAFFNVTVEDLRRPPFPPPSERLSPLAEDLPNIANPDWFKLPDYPSPPAFLSSNGSPPPQGLAMHTASLAKALVDAGLTVRLCLGGDGLVTLHITRPPFDNHA